MSLLPLTIDEVLVHCYTAIETFLTSSQSLVNKALAENLTYDVYINHKLGNLYGRAFRKGKIKKRGDGPKGLLIHHAMEFNYQILSQCDESFRFQTVSHELAHLLDFEIRGHSGHDIIWMKLHLAMGGDGKRCGPEISIPTAMSRYKVVDKTNQKTLYMCSRRFNRYIHIFAMNKDRWHWEELQKGA